MITRAPNRSRPGRWWEALIGAGPLVVVFLLGLVVLVLVATWRLVDPTPDRHIVIATGPEQGAYIEFAKRYRPLLRAQGVELELRPTGGSQENIGLLRDRSAGVQAAFVQGGIEAADGEDTVLASVGSVAYEPIWIFYAQARAAAQKPGASPGKAGAPERLTRLTQLAGWRINTGPAGGGAAVLLRRLAQANGLDPAQLDLHDEPSVSGIVGLLQGRYDALVLVAAADAPLVQYLLQTPGVGLFEFAQAEAYARRFPFLRALTLPRGLIDLAADRPPQDVPLVAATASLVVRKDLHPALVQLLVQAAHQVHGDAGWFHRPGDFPNAGASEWPIADEAQRYYRNGRPWLQRYLPFWVANFIERMWIVLLPLLAALIPLSRILPPLVSLRLRSRVYRWYGHLRAVEQQLERPAPDLVALLAETERIDTQAERVGLPLSFTHELYALRSHIQLVQRRIQDRIDAAP
jgi:TRAP-type uncharacterized transport system substrate-binding protein